MIRRATATALVLALATPAFAGTDPGTTQAKPNFRDAVTAPLEDLNLKQSDIPPVLRRAVANPYDVKDLKHCEQIAAEIGRLDSALGPDLDEAPPPDTRSKGKKLASAAHDAGADAVKDRAHGLVPFRGLIRKLTGAEKHDKAFDRAVRSGGIRRGYLKGVGMRMNCAPPAAPSWFVPHDRPHTGFLDRLWSAIVAWFKSWWPF